MFTKQLSDRQESISSVLPVYRCLINFLQKTNGDIDEIVKLKRTMEAGLKKKWIHTKQKGKKQINNKFQFIVILF